MGFFKKALNVATLGAAPSLGKLLRTPRNNPADAANPLLEQIPGVAHNAYDPYILSGKQAQGLVDPMYRSMAQDPGEWLRNVERQYSPSEGYRFKQQEGMNAMRNSAAAGGYAGTPYDQAEQSKFLNGLLGEDMQQFLSNYLGIHGQGMGGLEQRVERGFGASGSLADMLAGNLSERAGLAFQGQSQMNQHKMDRNAALMKFISSLGSAAAGAYGAGKGQGTQMPDSLPSGGSGINFNQRGTSFSNSRPNPYSNRGSAFGSWNDYMSRR